MTRLPEVGEAEWGEVINSFLLTSHNNDGTLKVDAVDAAVTKLPKEPVQTTPGAHGLPLFNVEHYGAVGDGVTDDYKAIAAAWKDMLASGTGGCVFFPRPVVYRVHAGVPGRVAADTQGAYALFRLPYVAATKARLSYGVAGVGVPYTPRGDSKSASATSSTLFIDYTSAFSWSDSKGLPAVFGAPDYDVLARSQTQRSNIHFCVDNLTVRQPVNPSLCAINVESCASATIGSVAFDVAAGLTQISEPTHPTGAALLLPAGDHSGAATVDTVSVVGHYTGVPHGEYADIRSALISRCKIAVPCRRGATRFTHIASLTISQCPWGFAGYSPQAGVVPVPDTCTIKVDYCDLLDDSASGKAAWAYAPGVGAHFYDPDNYLDGLIWVARNDVDSTKRTDAMWVTGATNFTVFGLLGFSAAGSERIDASAHTPAN